jgi:predicted Zn-dependent protease with MMP-like domain
MDRKRFEFLVAKTAEALPDRFLARLQNIDVVVEDHPTYGQTDRLGLRHGQTMY